jgi:hypothetical protein
LLRGQKNHDHLQRDGQCVNTVLSRYSADPRVVIPARCLLFAQLRERYRKRWSA